MRKENLAARGQVLFGDRWQTPLANSLKVSNRTMRRWYSGALPIPNSVFEELDDIIKGRMEVIVDLLGGTVDHINKIVVYPVDKGLRHAE